MILGADGWHTSPPAGSGHALADGADADAEDEDGHEGNETPRLGMMEYRDRRGVPTTRMERQHANPGGWGLGVGNEEKEDDDDDDETMNWDQAQVKVKLASLVHDIDETGTGDRGTYDWNEAQRVAIANGYA